MQANRLLLSTLFFVGKAYPAITNLT